MLFRYLHLKALSTHSNLLISCNSLQGNNVGGYTGPVLSNGRVIISASGTDSNSNSFGQMLAYSSSGSLLWSYDTHAGPNISVSPDESIIYATATQQTYSVSTGSSYSSSLYGFQTNGTYLWKHALCTWSGTDISIRVNDKKLLSDGTVIVSWGTLFNNNANSMGQVLGYNPSGSLLWSYDIHGLPNIKVSSDENKLYITATQATYSATTYRDGQGLSDNP